jgi:hypothetical protein
MALLSPESFIYLLKTVNCETVTYKSVINPFCCVKPCHLFSRTSGLRTFAQVSHQLQRLQVICRVIIFLKRTCFCVWWVVSMQ